MKFYQKDYRPMTDLSGGSDFNPGMNLYWDVKDFHWLKNHVKSPNFDVFTEDALRQEISLRELMSSFSNSATEMNKHEAIENENVVQATEFSFQENNNNIEEDSSEDEL
jgi:hypothetical protein